jgi:hypothetical protein
MRTNKFELHKSPLFTFKWIGFKDIITNKVVFNCYYTRYANFLIIALGPIEFGFRMPWLKYNIWIRGYEAGYRNGWDSGVKAEWINVKDLEGADRELKIRLEIEKQLANEQCTIVNTRRFED